ncbi:MAG TPA: hypothetical protein VMX35_09425, partial [Acidobacteriota bacterium]|nr:hypothetical protein [Acidobacteriota bacterium]
LASTTKAMRLLRESIHLYDHEIETMDEEDSAWISDLKNRVMALLFYATDYETWQKLHGERGKAQLRKLVEECLEEINSDEEVGGKYIVELFEDRISGNTLAEILVSVLKKLQERDSKFLENLSSKGGRLRRIVAKSPELLYPGSEHLAGYSQEVVPTWWVATNNSRQAVHRILKTACDVSGIKYGNDMKVHF